MKDNKKSKSGPARDVVTELFDPFIPVRIEYNNEVEADKRSTSGPARDVVTELFDPFLGVKYNKESVKGYKK